MPGTAKNIYLYYLIKSSQKLSEENAIITPILQMKKLRLCYTSGLKSKNESFEFRNGPP